MKAHILTMSMIAISIVSYAQQTINNKIPVAVQASFSKMYPLAGKVKWNKEDGGYEAGFIKDKVSYSVLLDEHGKLIETEVGISFQELPVLTKQYIASHFKNAKLTETARITDSTGKVTYEVEINHKDVMFNDKGVALKP